MKITYTAFDNTEFDTEKECQEYEIKHKPRFFNSEGAPIDFCANSCPDIILLPTVESVNYFKTVIGKWPDKNFFENDFYDSGFYIYAIAGHYYKYNKYEIEIVENLMKERKMI